MALIEFLVLAFSSFWVTCTVGTVHVDADGVVAQRFAGLANESCLLQAKHKISNPLSKVRFLGRWYPEGIAMKHSWGTGTFLIRFRNSASVSVALESPQSGAYYVCRVDDQPEVRLLHRSGLLAIATGLSLGEHITKCGRSGEASYGETLVSGVIIDDAGELLRVQDSPSRLRYEAIGDSITAGFKVTVSPGSGAVPATPENEDVFKTYVRHLADAWHIEDFHVIAKSGISILPYADGSEKVMGKEWPCRSFWAAWQGGCPTLWDFTSWQADIVTINLGTNDFAFGNPTREAFKNGYKDLIMAVRAGYPRALIICIQPLQYSCGGGSTKLQAIVDGLEDAVRAVQATGDSKLTYHTTGTIQEPWLTCRDDYIDYTHPTVEGNKKFADKLLETLTADVREFYPDQCHGTGITCHHDSSAPAVVALPTPQPSTTRQQTPLPTQQPTATTTFASAGCVAVLQSDLPAGSWATTNEHCAKCTPGYPGYPDGYPFWPCVAAPALCRCDEAQVSDHTYNPTPIPSHSSATTEIQSTPAPTHAFSSNPCRAVTQSSLPAGAWATTNDNCEKCAPGYPGYPRGYPWWPCDSNPALCMCT